MPSTGAYAFEGVNTGILDEVHQTFTGFLYGALGQNPRWTQTLEIANDLPVRGNVAKAKMASIAYGVHEWVDERHKAKIEHADHEVTVKRWANAISLKVDDLEDEDSNLGQYRLLIGEMADDFDEHRHTLYTDLLAAGFAGSLGLAYDGQFFFDTDHPIPNGEGGTTTQSNKDTAAFTESALYTAIKAMETLKKPTGKIANIYPTHIVAPAALRSAVEKVLLSGDTTEVVGGVAATKTNLMKGRVQAIIDPRLDAVSETAWFLIDASKALKPFFSVSRKPVTPQISREDEFEIGVTHWGAYARYNASYGFYQTMWASTGAGS